ncbi:MAG: sigma-54-dependent Fis family transcriptional regulator, partial [Bacteroidetes bacterium]|nr:sigma-54-dependent Fis family transcriptional regulator [Bacteroidota bacterium]
ARHFVKMYTDKYLKPAMDLDSSAIQKLRSYNYPGNIRELQYTIERAVIMADSNTLKADDLIFSILETPTETNADDDNVPLSTMEKNAILRVIEKNNGNITRAAKELGLTRTALYRRLSKYDI